MPGQVDYDSLAATYNRRFSEQAPGGTLLALRKLVQDLNPETVLEVGCGTGHWLVDLSPAGKLPALQPTCRMFGLDFSAGMLAQAQMMGLDLALVQGRAEDLPFQPGTFDLVYCVNAIHHFQRQRDFIAQAYQVIKPGGALAVLGMDPHDHRQDWYVYEYFEGTFETDVARFPSWARVMNWMSEVGFEQLALELVEVEGSPKYGPAVWQDPFLAKHSCSQLALLTDQAYAAGLARIRGALADAEAAGSAIVFPTTIRIHQLVGKRKSR